MKKLPNKMCAVLLTGHGGFDKLVFRDDVPVPRPGKDEVVINVTAAGVNNTDINTRIGWYSKSVKSETNKGGSEGFAKVNINDASWSGKPLVFPLIQGADCSGVIVATGEGVKPERIGERVVVRTMMQNPKIILLFLAGQWDPNVMELLHNSLPFRHLKHLKLNVIGAI